jgi:hypothetical protein
MKIKRRLSYNVSYWYNYERVTKYFESAKKMRRFVNGIHELLGPDSEPVIIEKTFCYRNHHPRHKSWYYSTEPNQFICYERYYYTTIELQLILEEVAKLPVTTDTCGIIPDVLDLVEDRLWDYD